MERLFELFLREKQYLSNTSLRTLKYFRYCFSSFKRIHGLEPPTKQSLNDYVIALRESGITIQTINSYIRGLNSFFSWAAENEHLEHHRIKQLKEPQRIIKPFSDQQLKALLAWKPTNFYEQRLYALVCLLIDTGIRIDEGLTLTKENLDLDNLIIKVRGKGDKERFVPISMECRRILFKFLKQHKHSLVFCTRDGERLMYRNILRDFKSLCEALGINGVRTSWHTLRHGFALNHIRQGGDVFTLQRILGHTSLEITKRYVDLTDEDLKLVHKKTSILGRLK